MKELSIEEKAKRYDEVIETFDVILNLNTVKESGTIFVDDVRKILPEFKESEDEKIRKELCDFCIKCSHGDTVVNQRADYQRWATWLEKQGEQKSEHKKINDYRTWLNIVSKVLTEFQGIGQYLDNSICQNIAKMLQEKYCFDDTSADWERVYRKGLDVGEVYGYNKAKKEQKLVEKVEPKFKVGDWVVNKFGDVWHIDSFDKKNYQVSNGDKYNYFPISKQNEMYLWTIHDAKDGDVLICDEEILLFKSYSAQGRISLHCWYNRQTNNFHSKEVVDISLTTRNKIYPATKEQRDLLFKKMYDAGYEWDADKKELKKIEQKPIDWHREDEQNLNACLSYISDEFLRRWLADIIHVKYDKSAWSEDDEKAVNDIMWIIEAYRKNGFNETHTQIANNSENWLKSLKERYTWKPSDEQMRPLEYAIDYFKKKKNDITYLESLYQDLKKLREE